MTGLWMVAYDISDNKTRRKVFNLLKNFGLRVQFSVFECRLDKVQCQQLRITLADLIEETDTIRWYPLCQTCEAEISWQGAGKPVETDEFYIV